MDMADSMKARAPVLAAGGIVLREGSKPRIAVVRLRREKAWVLPKGKLNPGEPALAAAKREVLEETGHAVSVHEFLGSMSYALDAKIKIVQFWRMGASGRPVRALMHDVKAVKWLSLKEAIDTLTRAHEKVFLANVGPVALKAARQSAHGKSAKPSARDGDDRRPRGAPFVTAEHLAGNGRGDTRRHPLVKAIGRWIGRVTQPSARGMG
jgi:8-oxo-dGTP diphosphatase